MKNPNKRDRSMENLKKALGELQAYILESTGRKVEKAGIIQGFEFCFERFWNLFQVMAEENGLSAQLPRLAISAAYHLGFLSEEALWLKMMKDRNLTSHVYNEETANLIHDAIVNFYAPEMLAVMMRIDGKS